jgi:hypothetical protein
MDRSIFDADRDREHRSDFADRTASLLKSRVKFGSTRVQKSRPGLQPKNENGPYSMNRVALDPPFFIRVTALSPHTTAYHPHSFN